MRLQNSSIGDSRGFTLVELLIAMAIASLVGMAAYTVFHTSNRSYLAQEDVAETQQNLRFAIDRLAKDIRAAGFGLPDPPFSLDIGGESHTAPVAINNSSTDSDSITLLGIGLEVGVLDMGSETDCNGEGESKICLKTTEAISSFLSGDPPAFDPDRRYISLDGVLYVELNSTQLADDIAAKKLALPASNTLPAHPYPDGTPVFIVQAVRYTINTSLTGCSATSPCLTRQDLAGINQTLAQNIEDLQVAYSLKGDPSFFSGTISGDTDIAALRISLVGKSRRPETGGGNVSSLPALEDRSAGAADKYRRRILTGVTKIRNPRGS